MSTQMEGLIPFVVGVTGHRDLRPQDESALRQQVVSIFESLRRRCLSTPILLLTALAEGADQLVAEVALEQSVEVVAIWPMPLPIYRTTMSPPAQQKLDTLAARCSTIIQLPRDPRDAELTSTEGQTACYEALARFLGLHSNALVALWDGAPGLHGGTAEVVEYVRYGVPGEQPAEERPARLVYHVVTPRLRHKAPPSDALKTRKLRSRGYFGARTLNRQETYEAHIDRFNTDALKLRLTEPGAFDLLEGIPDSSPFLQRITTTYRIADAIAIKYRQLRNLCLCGILAFSLVAIMGLEVHADLASDWYALWFVYPAALLCAFAVYRIARWWRVENRFYDSRALAEALRVQFYWELSGICHPVCDFYLEHKPADIGWILEAMRRVSLFGMAAEPSAHQAEHGIATVVEKWVRGQGEYFESKAQSQSALVERLERRTDAVLLLLIVIAVCMGLALTVPTCWRATLRQIPRFQEWVHFLIVTPTIGLGLFKIWVEQAGYDEQNRNYKKMAHTFNSREPSIRKDLAAGDLAKAREKLRELGIKALEENSGWLLMHRKHPLKVFSQ